MKSILIHSNVSNEKIHTYEIPKKIHMFIIPVHYHTLFIQDFPKKNPRMIRRVISKVPIKSKRFPEVRSLRTQGAFTRATCASAGHGSMAWGTMGNSRVLGFETGKIYGKWNLEIKRCVRMATEMIHDIHVRNDSKNSGDNMNLTEGYENSTCSWRWF